MPEISLLGWFHTIIAIIALLAGFYSLAAYKLINPAQRTSQVYLLCTFIAAATALMIYQQGGFGPAHMLAVLTLLALFGGFAVTKIAFFRPIADYFQAFCFTGTVLFHMLPAITDGLLRLPVGDPVLTDIHDPILKQFYLLFLIIFVVGFTAQFFWIRKNKNTVQSGTLVTV